MNCFRAIALSLFLVLVGLVGPIQAQLQMNYYANTCPNAEKIVQDFVSNHISNAPSLAAALLRMHFHDCFVRVNSSLLSFFLFILWNMIRIAMELINDGCIHLHVGLWWISAYKLNVRKRRERRNSKPNGSRVWLHRRNQSCAWSSMPWNRLMRWYYRSSISWRCRFHRKASSHSHNNIVNYKLLVFLIINLIFGMS